MLTTVALREIEGVKSLLMSVTLMIVLVLALSCEKKGPQGEPQDTIRTGTAAPDFKLLNLSGVPVKLSDYRGKVVLLEFWATWCPPCKASVPELVALQKQFGDQGFVVIGVSLDEGQDVGAKLGSFSSEHKINYPILIGTSSVATSYNVRGVPASFLIDREGRLAAAYIGFIEDFHSVISDRLAKLI